MATTVETKIAEALMARLAALVLTPRLPVAWPNVAFDPPVDQKWLRANDLPAPVVAVTLTPGTDEYMGVFQVDVMWPLNVGATPVKEIAGAITAHFARGTRLDREGVRIDISRAWIGPALRDDPAWMIPVSIAYRALA